MKIYRFAQVQHIIDDRSSDTGLPLLKNKLKQSLGRNVRRIDRFTQLALIGAAACKGDTAFPHNTGIILASHYGSLGNSYKVLSTMFQQLEAPMPYDFINTVSNAASYHLAHQLDLVSHNLFISQKYAILQSCLQLAELDTNCFGLDAVLIGEVNEVGLPLSVHRHRMGIDESEPLIESSHWFLVSKDLKNEQQLAQVYMNKESGDPVYLSSLINTTLDVFDQCCSAIAIQLDSNLCQNHSEEIWRCLQKGHNNRQLSVMKRATSSAALVAFIEASSLDALVVIERKTEHRWSALLIVK